MSGDRVERLPHGYTRYRVSRLIEHGSDGLQGGEGDDDDFGNGDGNVRSLLTGLGGTHGFYECDGFAPGDHTCFCLRWCWP